MGTPTGPAGKPAPKGVPGRQLVVIALLLVVILLPTALASMPLSKIVVTVKNMTTIMVGGHVTVSGASDGFFSIALGSGDETEWSFEVWAGNHEINVYYHSYDYTSGYYFGNTQSETVGVPFMGTETVTFTLT